MDVLVLEPRRSGHPALHRSVHLADAGGVTRLDRHPHHGGELDYARASRAESLLHALRHDDVNIQRGFGISSQLFSDWIRLAVLARFGGVWLDATTLALRPPEAWVDMASEGLQGYSLPSYNQDGVMESFALAAPPHNALIALTKERFQEAISEGVKLWVDSKSEDVTGPDCSEASVKAARQASGDSSSPASVFCRSLKPMLALPDGVCCSRRGRLARPTGASFCTRPRLQAVQCFTRHATR